MKYSKPYHVQHDVFLILFFALFTDVVEFRMRLLIIFDLQYRGENYGGMMYIPTTVTVRILFCHYRGFHDDRSFKLPNNRYNQTCTIVVNLIYAHFMITYVEAVSDYFPYL